MNFSNKWALGAVAAVFIGIIAAAAWVSRPANDIDPNTDPARTTNDTSLEVNDGTDNTALNEQENEVQYLQDFEPVTDAVEELQIVDLVVGEGQEVQPGDTVTAHYTGAYAINGLVFESSKTGGQPFTSPLSNLIPGWVQGIPGMREGGTRRLIIPGSLAYGEAPSDYVPGQGGQPLGPLVFDIELISTQR